MADITEKIVDSDHEKPIKHYKYSGFSEFNPERKLTCGK